MAEIVLIHGYGVGLSPSKKSLAEDLGFGGFLELLQRKNVSIFSWYQQESHSPIFFFRPSRHYLVYKQEKAAAKSKTVHKQLNDFLKQEQPETLVCHSLGSLLLLKYLEHNTPPKSVKKIVLVQSDIPNDLSGVISSVRLKELAKDLYILNIFCPWDPALLTSKLLHRYTPAGLTPAKHSEIHNKFVPLLGHWNLHAATIMQKQFATFVASL